MKEQHMSGTNSVGGSKCGDKLPRVNWLQHANAHDSFSNQNKLLSSNFLYSLSAQKSCTGASTSTRSMACQVLNLQSVQATQVEKAWQVLSSRHLSCRNYAKPGKTVPVVKDVSANALQNVRRTTQQSLSNVNNSFSGHMQTHTSLSGTDAKIGESTQCIGVSFPLHPSSVAEDGKVSKGQNERYTSMIYSSFARATNGISNNHMAQTSQVKGFVDMSPDCIGDDDILEVEQRRKEALSRTGEESQSALESSLQDVVSRYSFMDLWPCSSKDLDHLARQE